MKSTIKALLAIVAIACFSMSAPAQEIEQEALAIIKSYMPTPMQIGPVKMAAINIDDKKKTITFECNENTAYIPFDSESVKELYTRLSDMMGEKYAKYKIDVTADGKSLKKLALFADKKFVTPKERSPFVTRIGKEAAPLGLDNTNIAMWQSHGWYFEPKLNRWEWQRARLFETVEDLYTQSYVIPFLMPMLENAGAYVMSPRERDINTVEIIIDNDEGLASGAFSTVGDWQDAEVDAFAYVKDVLHENDNPFRDGSALKVASARDVNATATWATAIPADGNYAVYVSYPTLPNSTKEARYTVHAANGDHEFIINQRMGDRTWIYLGHFPLSKTDEPTAIVSLSNAGRDRKSVVTADAVKIGGGMGNVARKVKEPLDDIHYDYVTSRYPRFTEGARYWLQWAGAPDSVYTPSDNVNDYTDDYRSRGLWVNWLTGGSSVLPKCEGLNIPIDLSFAFHSDAGTTLNDSIIGTLGIYSTANGEKFPNGMSHLTSRDYTDLVMTNIVNDIRRTYEPRWTRRGMWDKSYYEARVPEVPAMLLELLSHQNFADMKYGLDPTFRFTVSRAIYKGMLQFIAHRDGRDYVVQPLPVHNFAITPGNNSGEYTLSWSETVDSLEATATPTYYIVEEMTAPGAFRKLAKVNGETSYTIKVNDTKLHAYRIVAGNDGGVSFPSEALALQDLANGSTPVTIVNGFTRISAPDWFEAADGKEIAGFYDTRDHGVPYLNDISFIGNQFEFRRAIPWMDDDAAGFGASRADYEDKVIAGNTFDYVITHGQAVAAAGHSFISTSVEAFIASEQTPAIVDLILGKQKEIARGTGTFSTLYKAFPETLQQRIRTLTEGGTSFFISGAYVATDIWDNPFSSEEVAERDKKFASEVLGYKWRVGQASVTGEAYQVPTRFKAFTGGEYEFSNELNDECYAVESPDSFFAADSKRGATLMRYDENNLVAGIAFDAGGYQTVVIGFPFETIRTQEARFNLMDQVLNFFTTKAARNNIER